MFTGSFETETPLAEVLLRMALAVLFGGIIGFERELKARPAGLRTHIVVSLAAATFTLMTAELIYEAQEFSEFARPDPLRIIDAVIAGVAFLGAGAIIRSGGDIHGLTTGGTLWLAGAIGVACGGGYYAIAIAVSAFALLVLVVLGYVEARLMPRPGQDDGGSSDG